MRLILIRHGASEHATRGLIAAVTGCTGLTAHGRAQAAALAARVRQTGELRDCTALLSSPVLRARQTADILAPALPVRRVAEDPDLREILPGVADGLTRAAYRASYGEFDLSADVQRPFAPGGESWADFSGRVELTLARLARRFDGQTVVAVSHAGFIVPAILTLFAIPRPGTGARLEPRHTALTEWRVSCGLWQLVRYNDAAHLPTPG